MCFDYSNMTHEDFYNTLVDLLNQLHRDPSEILEYPGVFEILSEALNNEVLDAWREKQIENDD